MSAPESPAARPPVHPSRRPPEAGSNVWMFSLAGVTIVLLLLFLALS
jgi:hypothetical protein